MSDALELGVKQRCKRNYDYTGKQLGATVSQLASLYDKFNR
jgi:hypothetical protein